MSPKIRDTLMDEEVPQEGINALKNIGLTGYEIKVYLTLLKNNLLDAKEISVQTEIPYSRIYEVLNSLYEKGFIAKAEGRPGKFFAYPPAEALSKYKEKRDMAFSSNSRIIIEKLMPLIDKSIAQRRISIYLLSGCDVIKSRAMELLSSARKKLYLSITKKILELIPNLATTIKNLRMMGVEIKVLALLSCINDAQLMEISKVVDTHYRQQFFGAMLLVDSETLLIIVEPEFGGAMYGIFNTNRELNSIAEAYFIQLWKSAITL